MKAIYHPEAETETIEAARFYSDRVPGLGADFLDEVDTGVHEILHDPERYEIVEGDIRRKPMRRFPQQIYYQADYEAIFILAVTHPARQPKVWKSRMEKR